MKLVEGKPVTITQFRESKGQGLHDLIALMSGSMWPIFDGTKDDPLVYSLPFETWLELCRTHDNWVHVGRFVYPTEANKTAYKKFITSEIANELEFLLLDYTGHPIALNLNGNLRIEDELTFKSGEVRGIRSQVRKILHLELGKEVDLVEPLYFHKNHDQIIGAIIPDLKVINNDLLVFMEKNHYLQHLLDWRNYEKFLAEIFRRRGYEVILGPGSGDEGIDIWLIERGDVGKILTLVQAKSYAPNRPINLEPVQALFGAVVAEGADKGIFATTSRFRPAAENFSKKEKVQQRIKLVDSAIIRQWLREVLYAKN